MRSIEGKVVVLGSRGVGKTCLVTKFTKNALHDQQGPTIGISFFTCKVLVDDVKIKLQIWDTAGEERFRAVGPMYYRNANAAILVFDITNHKSFTDLKGWIQELHRNVQEPLKLTLVGNKIDQEHEHRAVSRDEAFVFATSLGASYIETSAMTEIGLEQVFHTTALGLVALANEGKSRSLRQFDSCDSLASIYTNNNTAFSLTAAAMAGHRRDPASTAAYRLSGVPMGIPVEGDDVKANGMGRLETPSWSIDHIALGEVEPVGWCCY